MSTSAWHGRVGTQDVELWAVTLTQCLHCLAMRSYVTTDRPITTSFENIRAAASTYPPPIRPSIFYSKLRACGQARHARRGSRSFETTSPQDYDGAIGRDLGLDGILEGTSNEVY